ncbi:MAG: hypothetical protein ACE37H_00555 [Phycisphaeraceae bacterium]
MSQHNALARLDHPTKLRLVSDAMEDQVEVEKSPLPRWSKILDARDAIRAGHYDDPSVLDRKINACVDAMVGDLTPAG